MTREEALAIPTGHVVHETGVKNADGTCRRWKINGMPQAYKKVPENFRIPVKCGLYMFGYIVQSNVHLYHIPGDPECGS